MDPLVKIMGAIDIIAAILLIFNFPDLWIQIIGWALVIKGGISVLS
jgi:uncharacterized membrane protein YkgB